MHSVGNVNKINFQVKSLGLAILMIFSLLTKELHHLSPLHNAIVKNCATTNADNCRMYRVHLHGADFIPHECSLCDFTFSVYEFNLPKINVAQVENIQHLLSKIHYASFISNNSYLFSSLRAPPFV